MWCSECFSWWSNTPTKSRSNDVSLKNWSNGTEKRLCACWHIEIIYFRCNGCVSGVSSSWKLKFLCQNGPQKLRARGEPSTWFPRGWLVELLIILHIRTSSHAHVLEYTHVHDTKAQLNPKKKNNFHGTLRTQTPNVHSTRKFQNPWKS